VGMLYYQFECVLGRCVLEGIMFVWLDSVNKLHCLLRGGVGLLHILPRCGWRDLCKLSQVYLGH
jgi:hypothetical protein